MGLKRKKTDMPSAEADMTPMIDMTFQLIAFFMVLLNFHETDTNEKVKLPASELAKPPKAPPPEFFTIQVTADKRAIIAGQEVPVDNLKTLLSREAEVLRRKGKGPDVCTVFIRAHKDAPTGEVQKVISICQELKFEKFSLRAEEKAGY